MSEIGSYRASRAAGGFARAKRLTPEQRSESARSAAQKRWNDRAGRPPQTVQPVPPEVADDASMEASSAVVLVSYRRTEDTADLPAPSYKTNGAPGFDLTAAEGGRVDSWGRAIVRIGVAFAIPPGFDGRVASCPDLAVVGIYASVAQYDGELKIILENRGGAPFEWARGDRIGNLVIAPVARALLIRMDGGG